MKKVLITTGKGLKKFIQGKRCQGKGDSFRLAGLFTNLSLLRTFNLDASPECDRSFLF